MKRLVHLLALAAFFLVARGADAQDPLGSVAATFPYTPSKLLADPVRTRVYAADPTTNSVVIIDTTTLQVVATVPIGPGPVDMAISPDNNTLYVANGGSTLAAVAVLDLNALTVSATYPLPGTALAIAAGSNGRVYASASSDDEATIYQFDGPTGTMQATFNENYYDNNLFQISPDGTTLFVASTGIDYGTLKSFDVSTATPAALQVNSSASENDSQLVISHNGKFLCLPSGAGNPGAGTYETALFSTTDITTFYGALNNGAYPGPLAFSPDDSLVYQTRYGSESVLDVFSTSSFLKLEEVNLPSIGSEGYPDNIDSIVADNTGSYLFISESSSDGETTTGQLVVITTGKGTLTPSSLLPVITSGLSAETATGSSFIYQITASNTPTSFNATNLPAGLSVNTATGVISGTPTTEGFSEVTISATNASGTATATLELEVDYGIAAAPPVITTSSLYSDAAGQFYDQLIEATNSPSSYAATGLPDGLSVNASTGEITGTPTTMGSYSVTLSATNSYGTGTAVVSLLITAPLPVITSGTAAAGQIGTAFTYQITATNSPTSYTAYGLPTGLSFNVNSGLITGTPTVAGTFFIDLSATNAAGTGTSSLELTVAPLPPPTVTSMGTASVSLGQPFAYQITASGNPTSYAASGLPPGISVNTVTGLISGTSFAQGLYTVSLTGTNSSGTGVGVLILSVTSNVPVVTLLATTPTVTVGSGEIGEFTVSLSAAQTGDLEVGYTVKGTAINGTDYVLLSGTKKIKAGHTSKPIKIIPEGDLGGTASKAVKLVLTPGTGYTVGTVGTVKVKILAP